MILPLRRVLAVAVLASLLPGIMPAAEPAIIAKARARLGPDAALDGLKTVRYTGTLTTNDLRDPTKTISAKVEMLFQKPDQQRITATYEKYVETTALDSYEGWTRVQDIADPKKWRLTLLDADQVKRLRANTWQSVSYFRGMDRFGATVEDQGTAVKEGVTCQKIAFRHGPQITFFRYFDVATGRLVVTETESGATIREEGEIRAGGIRFPKTLITTTTVGDKRQTITLTYDTVTVNEPLPPRSFAVPGVSR